MGVSIFTDDSSMCTFATDEEVSEFVCVRYTLLHEYLRMSCWCSVYIILYSAAALCALHAGCVYLCVDLCIGCALCRSIIVCWGTQPTHDNILGVRTRNKTSVLSSCSPLTSQEGAYPSQEKNAPPIHRQFIDRPVASCMQGVSSWSAKCLHTEAA